MIIKCEIKEIKKEKLFIIINKMKEEIKYDQMGLFSQAAVFLL
jgi:hypothetical protein